jgi:RimJ/RimL family protein N-acetyltransferase
MSVTTTPALPTLEGERVRLRWLTDADVPALFAIFGDAEVTRYWSTPALPDESAAASLLAEIHDNVRVRRGFQWGIALRTDDAIIGTCTLYHPDFTHQRCEIGFALARAQWGRGYAAEAIRLALTHAFDELGFRRIEADVDPRNHSSLRTLERLGFVREGYLRERYNVNGEIQDSVYLGLLRSEWSGGAAGS